MTTFYVDYEGGNNANAGTSFALRWKDLTNGATAARIAAGDTIRVMASPDPVSLGINGAWTDGFFGEQFAIVSSTNATPIVVTLSTANYTNLGAGVGSTVHIDGHNTNTNANGVWLISATNGSTTLTLVNADGSNSVGNGVGGATGSIRNISNGPVKLASAINKNIACTGNRGTKTNWTASANVTCSVNTSDYKEGAESQSISVGAAFGTGLAAYWPTGTIDLSAYQQVTFWIKQTSGPVAISGDYKLQLCTDAVGAVGVHDIAIPPLTVLNRWTPITVDLATNLNSAIQSINFTVNVDRTAVAFLIDNIVACKASASDDSLTLNSLIGKNAAGEAWYCVDSINDVRIMIGGPPSITFRSSGAKPKGYHGVTETVTTYKREMIQTDLVAAAGTTVQSVTDSGTSGSPIVYSGGWNRTDMSTQTGETFFDGRNDFGLGLVLNSRSNISLDKLNFYRYNTGVSFTSCSAISIATMAVQHNSHAGIAGSLSASTITTLTANNNSGYAIEANPFRDVSVTTLYGNGGSGGTGLRLAGTSCGVVVDTIYCHDGTRGWECVERSNHNTVGTMYANYLADGDYVFNNENSNYNTLRTVTATHRPTASTAMMRLIGSDNIYILGGSSTANVGSAVVLSASNDMTVRAYFRNFTPGWASVGSFTDWHNARIHFEKYGGTAGDNRIYTDRGSILAQTAVRHTASGIAWAMSPTSSTIRTANNPLYLELAQIACVADEEVTVKAWMRRDNTELTMKLIARGGQLEGVESDVSASMTAAADTWEELTIQFTPTEDGVIQIEAHAYGGSTRTGYVDDMTISQ